MPIEKLTDDIQLPTQYGLDPRLDTPWYRDARQRTAAKKSPTTPARTGGVRQAVTKAVANWRSFTGSR